MGLDFIGGFLETRRQLQSDRAERERRKRLLKFEQQKIKLAEEEHELKKEQFGREIKLKEAELEEKVAGRESRDIAARRFGLLPPLPQAETPAGVITEEPPRQPDQPARTPALPTGPSAPIPSRTIPGVGPRRQEPTGQIPRGVTGQFGPEGFSFTVKRPGKERAPTTNELTLRAIKGDEEAIAALARTQGPGAFFTALIRRSMGAQVIDPVIKKLSPEQAQKKLVELNKIPIFQAIMAQVLGGSGLIGGARTVGPGAQGDRRLIRNKKTAEQGLLRPGNTLPDGWEFVK